MSTTAPPSTTKRLSVHDSMDSWWQLAQARRRLEQKLPEAASCRMDFLLLGCGFRSSGNDDSNGILRDFHGDSNGILLVIYDWSIKNGDWNGIFQGFEAWKMVIYPLVIQHSHMENCWTLPIYGWFIFWTLQFSIAILVSWKVDHLLGVFFWVGACWSYSSIIMGCYNVFFLMELHHGMLVEVPTRTKSWNYNGMLQCFFLMEL